MIPRSSGPNSSETDELVIVVLVPGLMITCEKTMVESNNPDMLKNLFMFYLKIKMMDRQVW